MHDLCIMVVLDGSGGGGGDVVFCEREMLGSCRLVRCRLDTGLPAVDSVSLGDLPSGAAVVNVAETPCLALSYRSVILLSQLTDMPSTVAVFNHKFLGHYYGIIFPLSVVQ